MANMIISDCEIKFQIDTGAQVNIICQKYVKKEQGRKSNTTLKMWNKTEIKQMIEKCEQCQKLKPRNQRETLSDGNGPWDKVGSDLFEIKGRNYLLVIDYSILLILSNLISYQLQPQNKLLKN